jgi:hypothetical protein
LFELEEPAPTNEGAEFNVDGSENNESEAAFEMPEGLDFSPKPATPDVLAKPTVTAKSVAPTTQPPVAAPPKMAPPPTIANATAPTVKPPPKPQSAPPQPKARPQATQPPPKMELEEELKLCFAKAYQSYRNLMILKLNDNAVIPFRWDPSYKNPKALETIELNQASVFKIAAKSQKPFHGAISPNEINSQFLDNWFGGHTPTYLTIIPLFFERDCVGLLLGAADEELDRKDSLQLMESTAHKVEANFGARLAS